MLEPLEPVSGKAGLRGMAENRIRLELPSQTLRLRRLLRLPFLLEPLAGVRPLVADLLRRLANGDMRAGGTQTPRGGGHGEQSRDHDGARGAGGAGMNCAADRDG